jgi:hypothetical protein
MSDSNSSGDLSDLSDLSGNESPRRVEPVYNEAELAVIDVFKLKYFEATSPSARKTIAKLDILPVLFNYWKGIGKIYNKKELRMKSEVCSSMKEY